MIGKDSIKYIEIGMTRCFFVRCDGGYLMIDTNLPGTYERFRRKLDRLGVNLDEIKYLMLTHHHDDHAGFAANILKDTHAKLIVHELAIPMLRKGQLESPFTKEGMAQGRFFNRWMMYTMAFLSMFVRRTWSYPPVEIRDEDFVVKGDDLDLLKTIGVNGIILHTPGHSSDSISVVLADGSALVADAAMNFMMLLGAQHRPIYAEDYNEVFKSWQKLIEHGAKVIYTAHGASFSADKLKGFIGLEGGSK